MDLTQHAAFATYAVCSALLVLKMLAVGHYTAAIRIKRKAFLNPEDARVLDPDASVVNVEDPEVERGLRAHRNDLESTLPFLAIGWVYLALDPSAGLASGLFLVFTIARVLFSICYFAGLQPWRSILFIVGEGALLVMLGQIVYLAAF
jgi:prostaglandin-E synthase 1